MSLILEALRKSEAERRRGTPPQLLDPPIPATPSPASAMPHEPRRLHRAVPAALAAAAIALLGYNLLSGPGDADPPPSVAARTPQAETALTALGVDDPVPADVAAPSAMSAPVAPPASALPAPAADAPGAGGPSATASVPAPVSDALGSQAQTIAAPPAARIPTTPDVTAAITAPRTSAQTVTALPEAIAPPPASRAAASIPPSIAATPAVTAQARPAAQPPIPNAQPGTGAAGTTRPSLLAELVPADRGALPPLRMSMHLWAPAPAQRFVILDGMRVGEGDRVGEAVIDEITAEGAVLAWRGRRLLVPVR